MSDVKEMSFDEALSSAYSVPAVEEVSIQPSLQNLPPSPEPTVTPSQTEVGESASGDWRGNPLYYQTGKKAGQLRRKPRISVAYEPDPNDSTIGGDLISGAMFITIFDIFMPGFIVLINNWVVKDKKDFISLKEMQLEPSTVKRLEPLAEASLRRIKLKGDPMVWFFLSMAGCYAFRFAQIKFERSLNEALEAKHKKE